MNIKRDHQSSETPLSFDNKNIPHCESRKKNTVNTLQIKILTIKI